MIKLVNKNPHKTFKMKKKTSVGWVVAAAQATCLPSMPKALGLIPSTTKAKQNTKIRIANQYQELKNGVLYI
jgi:hypothetical protein